MIMERVIGINAPPHIEWEVFSCLENWDKWNSVCRERCWDVGAEMVSGARSRMRLKQGSDPRRLDLPADKRLWCTV